MPPLITKRISLIVILVTIFIKTYAQSDFKPGYVITLSNDTLHGLINHKVNSINAKQCIFKKGPDSDKIIYTPSEIKAYRIDDAKFYVSKTVNGEKLFLEFLVDGIVNLYFYKAPSRASYFLEKDTSLVELTNEKIVGYRPTPQGYGEIKYERQSNKYKGDLTYAFRDDAAIFPKIRTASFDDKSLIRLAKQYHYDICHDYACIVYAKTTKSQFYIGPKVSAISSDAGMKNGRGRSDNYLQLSYGLQLFYSPARLFYRWSIVSGIEFSASNRYHGSYLSHLYSQYDVTYDVDIRYHAVRVPVLLQYTFPGKKIQPYISAGLNNTFLLSPSYTIIETDLSPSTNTTSSHNVYSNFTKYQRRLTVNAGVSKKLTEKTRLTIAIGYENRLATQNFNNLLDLQQIQSISLTAGLLSKI